MIDLPLRNQASSEGPALIPIVGNNTERGVESVLSNKSLFIFILRYIYATSIMGNCVYTQLCLKKPEYISKLMIQLKC